MILSAKHALKKIQNGELKVVNQWAISDELMHAFQAQQRPELFKQALIAALVLPGLFFILAIGNLFVDASMDFMLMMLKFATFSFIFIYPLSYWQQWRKNRGIKGAREVYFGENWFLFGKVFVRWKGLVSFKGCELLLDRDPKVLAIAVKGTGRGQVQQTFMVPLPDAELETAKNLVTHYNK